MARALDQRMKDAGVAVGDVVAVETAGFSGQGRLMPHHAFSDPSCLILKLESGYNVGLRLGPKDSLTRVKAGAAASRPAAKAPKAQGRPKIAVLGTGGTIASYVDYRTGAVHPAATAEELAFATPELFDHVDVEAQVVFQVFSEDLAPADWRTLAGRIAKAFEGGARGVVIPHGTDTLGYTAAALSFMLSDLPGPVVLVGAQRSSDRPSSDAALNLVAAARVAAAADLGEVVVAMHASSSDDRVAIHRGVRVRKNHTSRRDAFESVNQEPLGWVGPEGITVSGIHRARAAKGPRLTDAWEDDVGLVWSYPGMDGAALERNAGRGLVIAGTGLGHVPRRCLDSIERLVQAGTLVVMASQCIWGRTNLRVYSTGRDLLSRGVVEADDMLPEVAFVKLQHALGVANGDREKAVAIMAKDQAGERSDATLFFQREVAPS